MKLKALVEHISCDFKFKFDSTTCNSNQKWNNRITINVNVSVKNIMHAKKVLVGI